MSFARDSPIIGLVLQRSHLVTGDEGHYAGVVSEMEARGARVVPVFAGALDFSAPVKKFFYDPLGSGTSFVDAVVSLTGFALVGGPARQVRGGRMQLVFRESCSSTNRTECT